MADNTISVDFEINDKSVKESFNNISDAAGKLIKPMAAVTAAVGAAALAIAGIITKKSIDAASEYEDVVNSLNIAMASTGIFTKEASAEFRNFADEIQKTTKFSDDQVISSAALIQNLGKLSNEGLKTATKAALDLSTALGIDLNTASMMIGKAAQGNISSFGRLGIEIEKGSTDAETFKNTLIALSRFQDASSKSANTYSGALAQLKNSFGDMFKEIGRIFTKSPALIETFKTVSKLFSGFSANIKSGIGNTDYFKDIITNFSVIAQAGIESARRIGLSFELAYLRAEKAWVAFKVLSTAGFSDAFNAQLVAVNKEIDLTIAKFQNPEENPAIKFFSQLIETVQGTNGKLKEFGDGVDNAVGPEKVEKVLTFAEAWKQALGETKITALDAATSIQKALGAGIGNAFAAMGKAMATGKNGFKEFGKSVLSTLGGLAMQMGQFFILTGLGMNAAGPLLGLSGAAAIAAGIGLSILGGVLQGLGGGGGGDTGGGVSSGGGGATAEAPTATEFNGEINKPKTEVVINVEGNILAGSERDAGIFLAKTLQEYFDNSNGVLVTS